MGDTFSNALREAQKSGPLFWNANKLNQPWITSALNTIAEILSAGSLSVLEKSVLRIMQSNSGAPVLFYRSPFSAPVRYVGAISRALQFSTGSWL